MKISNLFVILLLSITAMIGCSDGSSSSPDDTDAATDSGTDTSDSQPAADELLVLVPLGVKAFTVTLASADQIQTISCPGTAPDGYVCGDDGLTLSTIPSKPLQITLKIRGFTFPSKMIDPAELVNQSGKLLADLGVKKLDSRVINEDYATGLETQEEFNKFAVKVDTELGEARVVKFYISNINTDNPTLYFQNTVVHPIHYAFVADVLGINQSMSEFEQTTYRGEDRTAMGGSIVYYPALASHYALKRPFTITFFPSDDLTPRQASYAYRIIEERMDFAELQEGDHRVVYMPAGQTQEEQLKEQQRLFDMRDDRSAAMSELFAGITEQRLNKGIAFGTLKRLTPDELKTTVVSFRDILILTRLPNELPLVGGTITEELQTPLAHVNVAARNRGTPNLALLDASNDERVKPFIGEFVRFEISSSSFSIKKATLEEAQKYWDDNAHPEFIPEHDDADGPFIKFADLKFEDWRRVGVKAANVAELTRVLPNNTPTGFAVRFAAFDKYMNTNTVTGAMCDKAKAKCIKDGRTEELCERVRVTCAAEDGKTFWQVFEALDADTTFKTDSPYREASLAMLQYLIEKGTLDDAFATSLTDLIAEMFGTEKVRIRSSTNAEDLETFSGAGLYRSVSAYASGKEKLAPEQILKVWASLFTFRAYEEREFWNVKHRDTRMGCAVETSYPDEQANGVIITQNISNPTVAGMYVNVQLGEEPVTNPENGTLPEVFVILPKPGGSVQVQRQRFSSLSPSKPLLTDAEIVALYMASSKVHDHFAPLYKKHPALLTLDLEFKFHGPKRDLIIKQARPYNNY